MEIKHVERDNKGAFYAISEEQQVMGEMTYSIAGPERIIIDHTEVSPAYNGQGVGAALVIKAVEWAREQGKKILPLCPFAAAQFKRHPEWSDVLFQ